MGELGTLVREGRTRLNLSLRAAATRAGINWMVLDKIERGQRLNPPPPSVLSGLSRALDIPYEKLALAAYGVNGSGEEEEPVPVVKEEPRSDLDPGERSRTDTHATS